MITTRTQGVFRGGIDQLKPRDVWKIGVHWVFSKEEEKDGRAGKGKAES